MVACLVACFPFKHPLKGYLALNAKTSKPEHQIWCFARTIESKATLQKIVSHDEDTSCFPQDSRNGSSQFLFSPRPNRQLPSSWDGGGWGAPGQQRAVAQKTGTKPVPKWSPGKRSMDQHLRFAPPIASFWLPHPKGFRPKKATRFRGAQVFGELGRVQLTSDQPQEIAAAFQRRLSRAEPVAQHGGLACA